MNLSDLEKFISMIPQYTQQEAQLDEILGNDAPEIFICPISCDLMREPVLLPSSGNICDLKSMKRILLNDEHDPFNRAPLRISDLIEQVELKGRIERWISQKIAGVETDEDKLLKEQPADTKMIDENDYSSSLFDDDQVLELKGVSKSGLQMSQPTHITPLTASSSA